MSAIADGEALAAFQHRVLTDMGQDLASRCGQIVTVIREGV